MTCDFSRLYLVPMLVIAALTGCGEESPRSDAVADALSAGSPEPGNSKAESTDAAAAVKTVVDGFQQNRAEAIWEFLPPGHQAEINGLARDFAVRMDAELWQKTAAVARESAGLLKTRKQSFLSHPVLRDSRWGTDGTLSNKWDGLVALLVTVTGGELSDLDKMKAFDGAKFFAEFDADSLAELKELSSLLGRDNPFSLLREMTSGAEVSSIIEINDQAVVKIRPKQSESRRFPFRRVDGKWLPESWAEDLLVDIRRARGRLDVELAPSVLAIKKKIVLPYLDNAQVILDKLKNAKSDEEFHSVMTEYIVKPAIQVGATESNGGTAPIDLVGQAADAITIVISRELASAELEQIADALLNITDSDFELTNETRDGQTTFVLSPVKDLSAFVQGIQFGKVTEVDVEGRTINVEVISPLEKK